MKEVLQGQNIFAGQEYPADYVFTTRHQQPDEGESIGFVKVKDSEDNLQLLVWRNGAVVAESIVQ